GAAALVLMSADKAKELGITDKLYLIKLRQKNRWQRVHENSMRIFKADRNHFFESHEKSNSLYIKAWSFVEESYQRLESIESEFDETEGSVLLNFVTLNVQDFVINCEVVSEIISDLEYVFLIIKDKFEHDVDEFQLMAKSLGVDGKEEEIGFMRKDYEELYKKISKDFPEQLEGLREIKLRFPINVETFFPNAKNNSTNI
ncbi:MAG: hypothetical protein WCR55_13395, partial [Lentisphaerota bacterium]